VDGARTVAGGENRSPARHGGAPERRAAPQEGIVAMTRRSLIAARVSVSSLALGLAVAAWALANGLLSRL